MNDDDDLRELWQSQPVEKGPGTKAPRFGLLEDMTVPVFAPLSPWRRVSYAAGFACLAFSFWHEGYAPGWLHQAAAWTAIAAGLAGAVLALVQRDRTHETQPEESIQSYRTALRNEFERQFRIEKRILLLLCGGYIAVSSLWAAAKVVEHQPLTPVELAGLVFLVGLVIVGARIYHRAADAVRARLKSDADL